MAGSSAPRGARVGSTNLGNVGSGMARNVRRKQFPLVMHDIAPGPVRVLDEPAPGRPKAPQP